MYIFDPVGMILLISANPKKFKTCAPNSCFLFYSKCMSYNYSDAEKEQFKN